MPMKPEAAPPPGSHFSSTPGLQALNEMQSDQHFQESLLSKIMVFMRQLDICWANDDFKE